MLEIIKNINYMDNINYPYDEEDYDNLLETIECLKNINKKLKANLNIHY